jgi:hypothetical protein
LAPNSQTSATTTLAPDSQTSATTTLAPGSPKSAAAPSHVAPTCLGCCPTATHADGHAVYSGWYAVGDMQWVVCMGWHAVAGMQ